MATETGGLSAFGFALDPFEHLDSTKDAHLYEYLVIPKAAEIALSDQPVAIFAQPGGGKSALRMYTARFYRDSRGFKFPITYIPESYSSDPNVHFEGIKSALARAIFMYLVSYPDLYFVLPVSLRQKIKLLFTRLPLHLEYLLDDLMEEQFIVEIENILDEAALSGLQNLNQSHRRLAEELAGESFHPIPMKLEEYFELLADAFGAKSIHILVDGLDGFIETRSSQAVMEWIEPLLNRLVEWAQNEIYLKFFLPMDIADVPIIRDLPVLHTAALEWDDNLLANLIRRRVFVASGSSFDSLDAISAPDVRNAEFTLVRQLEEREKLPRYIILKCKNLLQGMLEANHVQISAGDLISAGERNHVASL